MTISWHDRWADAFGSILLSPAEFAREFPREGQLVEFKEGLSATPLQEAAVAFSNADGGVVLLGVADDGTIVGRALTQRSEETIHSGLRDGRDLGRYAVHQIDVGEQSVIAVSIAARVEGFAQTSSGRVLVRRGPGNAALFGAELAAFVHERSLERFEGRPVAVSVRDAPSERLVALSRAYGWSDASERADRLRELGLVRPGGELTVAGALHLLDRPTEFLGKAYVEILRFRDDSENYDKRTEISGPLSVQVQQATTSVLEELGTELVVLGVQRHELHRIPEVVLRETIANAVAHRSYESARTAVRIDIRPSAVVVTSPGPLPAPVTVQNIRDAQAPRNLAVIRVLRQFGLAEDAGRGIDVIQDCMQAELLDAPRFRDTGHSVEVTLPLGSTVTARERAWVRETERRGHLAPSDRILLVHAARGEILTNRRVRDITQLDRVEATRALRRLTQAGFLQRTGERGAATYYLDRSLGPPAGLQLSREERFEAVMRLAEDGQITNASVRASLELDRVEALRLLEHLVRIGRLERRGGGRGTHYVHRAKVST